MKQSEKEDQLKKHKKCYICEALKLRNADFTGYEMSQINFDHWKPKGLLGNDQRELVDNQVPIHAHPDGASYKDEDFETAVHRNCHKGKGNKFQSGQEWAIAVGIWRKALKTHFSDDLMPDRNKNSQAYKVSVEWNEQNATVIFRDSEYPLMIQTTEIGNSPIKWKSFSTLVPANILWTDDEVQSRPATMERLAELAIHLRKNPLLSPILCRLSENRLKVFDGNHRLCAFILARPADPVPVTIFEGPDPKMFLEVVAKAHDELTQQKYQYTAKALKYSALNADELAKAQEKHGELASEKLAWSGKPSQDVRLRIIGKLTETLDREGGWRMKWKDAGLTDKSWNEFISMYAKLSADDEPFKSNNYLRENEAENLSILCRIFDEELFDHLNRIPEASASLKTKWWKMAHKRFYNRAAQVIRDTLKLPETPNNPAYTKKWNTHIKTIFRKAVKKWVDSPAWRKKTTANNEPEVAAHLTKYGFTENYLM